MTGSSTHLPVGKTSRKLSLIGGRKQELAVARPWPNATLPPLLVAPIIGYYVRYGHCSRSHGLPATHAPQILHSSRSRDSGAADGPFDPLLLPAFGPEFGPEAGLLESIMERRRLSILRKIKNTSQTTPPRARSLGSDNIR